MKVIALLLVISLVHGFPSLENEERNSRSTFIVGGSDAFHGEFPYQLSFQKTNGWRPFAFCGASIYNEKYAITAAHCVHAKDNKNLQVVAGDWHMHETEETEQVRKVSRVIIHEGYNPHTTENDIALLEIEGNFDFNLFVAPIAIPEQGQDTTSDCIVTGWGLTTEGGSRPDFLQKATVPVITDDKCREYYKGNSIPDSAICAGVAEGGIDSCQGDSGGPMMCNGYLAGIVSWGHGCARKGYPGVYAEVAYYVDWIKKNTHQ